MPTSWLMTSAISAARACEAVGDLLEELAAVLGRRSPTMTGNARAAAWTARSTSSSVPAGIVANSSSVAESMTVRVLVAGGRDPLAVDVEARREQS